MKAICNVAEESVNRTCVNCVHIDERGRECRALQTDISQGPCMCSFHQTEEEKQASKERFNRRMNSLSKDLQVYYAGKYYNGKMPWRKDRR